MWYFKLLNIVCLIFIYRVFNMVIIVWCFRDFYRFGKVMSWCDFVEKYIKKNWKIREIRKVNKVMGEKIWGKGIWKGRV